MLQFASRFAMLHSDAFLLRLRLCTTGLVPCLSLHKSLLLPSGTLGKPGGLCTPHAFGKDLSISSSGAALAREHQQTRCRASVEEPREWAKLASWRALGPREDRWWGPLGPAVGGSPHDAAGTISLPDSLAEFGRLVLTTAEPARKADITHIAYSRWLSGRLTIGTADAPSAPSRPAKPELVHPRAVPQPGRGSPLPASAHAMHNLAHIELNAIDLAWDTVVRFAPLAAHLGAGFVADFAHVADDESRHLSWCLQRLHELGFSYGDMPAHNLLWRDCAKSAGDVSARLAIIPMVQEARGLDAGPRVVERLMGVGDHRSAAIVAKIAEEEVAHVAVGVAWFTRVCKELRMDPGTSFRELLAVHGADGVRGPYNHEARAEAGLPRHWYDEEALAEARGESREGDGPPAGTPAHGARKWQPAPAGSKGHAVQKRELARKVERMATRAQLCERRVSDPEFGRRAPEEVLARARDEAKRVKEQLDEVHARLALLVAMEEENVEGSPREAAPSRG